MIIALWDIETGTLVDEYRSETAALTAVYQVVQTHGERYAETFALVRDDGVHAPRTISAGSDLVARARQSHDQSQRDRLASAR